MTNAELIAKIKAEIERLYNDKAYSEDRWDLGYDCACEDIMSFLSTLESEKPVPADLEEAAMNYIAPIENEDGLKVINFSGQDIKDAFIAGYNLCKEQMMKEAVEGEVRKDGTIGYFEFSNEQQFHSLLEQFQDRDKVRIIIVKED